MPSRLQMMVVVVGIKEVMIMQELGMIALELELALGML